MLLLIFRSLTGAKSKMPIATVVKIKPQKSLVPEPVVLFLFAFTIGYRPMIPGYNRASWDSIALKLIIFCQSIRNASFSN